MLFTLTAALAAPTATITVTVVPTEPEHLEVSLEVPSTLLPEPHSHVQVEFFHEAFDSADDGFRSFVFPSNERWAPRVPHTGGDLSLTFDVRLNHHTAHPRHGPAAVPHPTDGGFTLVHRAFVPMLALEVDPESPLNRINPATEVVFQLPEDWRVISSTRGAVPMSTARDAASVVGEFVEEVLTHEASTRLVTSDYDTAALQALRTLIERTETTARSLLGGVEGHPTLVILDRGPTGAAVIGDAIVITTEVPPDGKAASASGRVLVRQLARQYHDSDPGWMRDGFAEYFHLQLIARMDGHSADQAIAPFMKRVQTYRDYAGAVPLSQARGEYAQSGGAVAAFCIDTWLREQDQTLAEVHHGLTTYAESGSRIGEDDLFDALAAAGPEVVQRARTAITQLEPIDVNDCLMRAGFAVIGEDLLTAVAPPGHTGAPFLE